MKQDALEIRILGFLASHSQHSFTVEQLVNESSISGTSEEIQKKLYSCAKEGLIREIIKDNMKSYTAMLRKSK